MDGLHFPGKDVLISKLQTQRVLLSGVGHVCTVAHTGQIQQSHLAGSQANAI